MSSALVTRSLSPLMVLGKGAAEGNEPVLCPGEPSPGEGPVGCDKRRPAQSRSCPILPRRRAGVREGT